eukprot:scaffold926_cov408-Prasinococcus_capsulatus_cf.AAC.5
MHRGQTHQNRALHANGPHRRRDWDVDISGFAGNAAAPGDERATACIACAVISVCRRLGIPLVSDIFASESVRFAPTGEQV